MFTTRPDLLGTFGMVASTHWLASAVGMAILEKGGNAFDAAVATGFVLQVAEPHLNGPGGDVPILLYNAASGQAQTICGQGVAPAAATIAHYRDLGLDLVPGTGLLSAVVPGAFDAWLLMLRDHGTMRLEEVLAPAISYAETGMPLVGRVSATIASVKEMFQAHWPTSAALWLPGGAVPQPGSLFANPTLAATWRRLLDEAAAAGGDREAQIEAARRAWYEGFVAEAIDRFCRTQEVMDVSGRAHRGLLTGDDMAAWRASVEAPLTYEYHGVTVCKTGPWGQGPVFLQQLALLRDIDLVAMDPLGAPFVHTVVEAAKLAFADREAWYGDPAFVDVPMAALLSDGYNAERRRLIGETASLELRPGSPDGRAPRLVQRAPSGRDEVALSLAAGGGEPTVSKAGETRGDTCHIDVVDRWGNMVSATPSGGWLQSSPTIPELGFCLPSRGQMFWLEEGLPSSLAPRKRPRTTLTPTLVLKDGVGLAALGTPGGDQQDQWSLLMFLRWMHHGMSWQQAIDAPSFHTAHFPSSFWPREGQPGHLAIETRFAEAELAALAARGHKLERAGDWALGRLSAVSREVAPGGGTILKAGANARLMQGYAIGR